jgi:hypothetical protein
VCDFTGCVLLAAATNVAPRLEAQHLLFRMHNGFVMNPKIPVSSDMKIAEIGTGTG